MCGACLSRYIVDADQRSARAVAADILLAPGACKHTAVGTVCAFDNIGRLLEAAIRFILVYQLHYFPPERDGRILGRIGQDNLLRIVIADPDGRSIIWCVATEPAVIVRGGRTGFTGDVNAVELRAGTGAILHDADKHIGQIPRRQFLDSRVCLLRVVENDIAALVEHLRIGARFPVGAVVGESCIGRSHCLDRNTVGQPSERHRREVDISVHLIADCAFRHQRGEPKLFFRKGIGVFHTDIVTDLDRNGVRRALQRFGDRHQAAIGPILVARPGRGVRKRIWRVVVNRDGRNDPEV